MSELQAANERIAFLEEKVAKLEALIEWFKKHSFGTGKSERQDARSPPSLHIARPPCREPHGVVHSPNTR